MRKQTKIVMAALIALTVVLPGVLRAQGAISSLSGDNVTVSVGAARGVKAGMLAYVMDADESTGKKVSVKIAKIKITEVLEKTSRGLIIARSQGYADRLRAGLTLQFIGGLKPPAGGGAGGVEGPAARNQPPREAAPPRKPEQTDPRQAAAAAAEKAAAGLKTAEKIRYARGLLDAGKFPEAVAVYRLIARELPDPTLYGDDYARARQGLAELEARAQREAAERAEAEETRANLDLYRMYVDAHERKGEFDKAVAYQEKICRAIPGAADAEKLRELQFEREKRKLGPGFYLEDLAALERDFPDKVAPLREQAERNAAARARRQAEEREAAERQRQAEEERKRRRMFGEYVAIPAGTFAMGSTQSGDE